MANKLRIIYDDAVDRATVIGSTNVLPASNLKIESRSDIWRSSQNSSSLNLSWSSPENISCVSLPYTNTSASATMRVRATNEASSTNLLPNTDNISAWVSNGDTGTIGFYGIAPDGTPTSTYINSGTRYRFLTVVSGVTYTYSYYVKAAGGLAASVYVDGITPFLSATFTFSTKAFTSVSGGVTPAYKDIGGGWYRISLTFVPNGANINVHAFPAGGGIEVWGGQVEVGGLTSYYPSTQTLTSRASSATYIDANGMIAFAGSNAARMQYQYPSLGAVAPRLLVETAATNMILYSETLSSASWFYGNLSSGTAIASPDGTTSALAVIDNSTNAVHYIQQSINLTAGVTYTLSVFLKPGTCTKVQLANSSLGTIAVFDLAAGIITTTGGSGYVSSRIEPMANGWFRASLTFTAATTGGQGMSLFMLNNQALGTYSGTGAIVYAWGFQCEVGQMASSYLATAGSQSPRAADVFTSATATRPLGYMDWWQSYSYDSGVVVPNNSEAIKVPLLTAAQSSSAYAYGGGRSLTVYMPTISVYALRVDISDVANLQGYIEAAVLVAGDYFSPTYGAEIGATVVMEDLSKSYRSDSGTLKKDVSAKFKRISADLGVITEANRSSLWKIVSYAGTSNPVWVSMFPVEYGAEKEQTYTIYGYFTKATEISAASSNIYSTKFEIEET